MTLSACCKLALWLMQTDVISLRLVAWPSAEHYAGTVRVRARPFASEPFHGRNPQVVASILCSSYESSYDLDISLSHACLKRRMQYLRSPEDLIGVVRQHLSMDLTILTESRCG